MADPMNALTESVGIRLDRTEKAVAQNTEAIAQLTQSIKDQGSSLDRLERSVSQLVSAIESQRKTMADMVAQHSEFFKTTNKALDIIDRLAGSRAA